MTIRVGFSTGRTLVSHAIRAITSSQVSHCFLLLDGPHGWLGQTMVLAADVGGFDPVVLPARRRPRKGYRRDGPWCYAPP